MKALKVFSEDVASSFNNTKNEIWELKLVIGPT